MTTMKRIARVVTKLMRFGPRSSRRSRRKKTCSSFVNFVTFLAEPSCLRGILTAWLAITVSLAAQGASRPTAPRIQLLPETQWTDDIRTVFTRFGRGTPAGNDFKTLARHPELLKNVVPFATYISSQSGLEPRHRELLILRAAWLCRAPYVWAHHAAMATRVGFSPGELHRVAEGPDARGWDPFESLLLRTADELFVNSFITDETWNALAARYDRARLLDALFTVLEYQMLAGAMNSFGVQPEQGLTERLPPDVAYRPAAAGSPRSRFACVSGGSRRSQHRISRPRPGPCSIRRVPVAWVGRPRHMGTT